MEGISLELAFFEVARKYALKSYDLAVYYYHGEYAGTKGENLV
jgi:hypothetical protein